MILHRLQRRYRIGIGCRRRPIKIPDFQPIFNILLPKCFASGALPRTPLGGGLPAPPDPQLRHVAEGPTELRAPGPRDPTIRHCLHHVAAHNATNDSEIQRVVANQYYVDKLNDSQRSTEGTLHLEHNLTVTLGRGNVNIRKWLSNKPDGCDTDYCPKDDIATALGIRVGEITYYFHPVADIAYVPSRQNVSYFVCHGIDVIPPVYWHTSPENVPVDNDDAKQKNFRVRNAKVVKLDVTRLAPIVVPTKFSSWPRLIMTTARVMSLEDVPRTQWLDENAKRGLWKMAEIVSVGGSIRNAPLSFDIRVPASS